MQRKTLVRCGFLPFPSRLRNHSLSFHHRPTLLPATGPSYSAKAKAYVLICFLELMGPSPRVGYSGVSLPHCPIYPPERINS